MQCTNINTDKIDIEVVNQPKIATDPGSRSFSVRLRSPYDLTAEDVIKNAKAEHQKALKNYDNVVVESKKAYEDKLKAYDVDVQKAKDKYLLETETFKKLTLIERLAITDQGKAPRLVIPSKPEYYKPEPPFYKEPDLKDFFIVNNEVLAGQISLSGFERGRLTSISMSIFQRSISRIMQGRHLPTSLQSS